MFGLINFWIPLIVIIQIYHFLPSQRGKNLCLLIASWGFYILIDWRVFPLLLLSTATDYIAGFLVIPKRKKYIRLIGVLCSLLINFGLLITFKYIPELFQTKSEFTSLLKSVGLPLGISFYTFQTISYTLDCYRGHIKPTSDLISFAVYVSFFPQLAAGPIESANNLLPQFQKPKKEINIQKIKEGFYLTLLGLFKKIYVAGALIHPLQRIYNTEETPSSLALLSGFLAILYVYVDFSAYSDLARGIAKFFGIDLMVNFKPFIFSGNPRDFWRKWHISLYKWISNYFLESVKKMIANPYLLSLVIFIPFALWHQITINWLLFGVFNATAVFINRYLKKTNILKILPSFFKTCSAILLMFLFHTINGLLYYSNDLETFLKISERILHFRGFGRETFDLIFYLFPYLCPLLIYEWFQHKHGTELFIMKSPFLIRAFWIALVIVCIFMFERNTEYSFVYFGF